MSEIEIDAETFAQMIREQKSLPITDDEAQRIGLALKTCRDDEAFLAIVVSTVRLLADRLKHSADDAPRRVTPAD